MRNTVMVLLATALMTTPTAAQQRPQTRTLEVPATARWQHARSGVILPARIGEFRRVGFRI